MTENFRMMFVVTTGTFVCPGVDVVKIKELMGHASIVTTMRYITRPIKGSVARLWCCQSIGNSLVASLSQANSVKVFHPL
jgi:hypothetical protein